MNNTGLNIDDFSESDFLDPISLLDAIKQKSNDISIINEVDSNQMLLISDVEKNYGLSSSEILRAIQAGTLVPASVIPVFSKEDIVNFCSTNLSSNLLYDSFEKELHSMTMSYSYKPILLLALIKNNTINKAVSIDEIIKFFFDYYIERKKNSLIVEKVNSTFVTSPNDRNVARKTILTYPVKVLQNKCFVIYDKDTDSVSFNPLLYSAFDTQYLEGMKHQCILRLEKYYSSL